MVNLENVWTLDNIENQPNTFLHFKFLRSHFNKTCLGLKRIIDYWRTTVDNSFLKKRTIFSLLKSRLNPCFLIMQYNQSK